MRTPTTLAVLLLLAMPAFLVRTAEAGPSKETIALAKKLETTILEKVQFEDHKLKDVVTWLRTATSLNFYVKEAKITKAGVELDDVTFTATLEKVSIAQVLDLMLEPHELAVKVGGNVVYITTKKDAWGKPKTKMYGISHITWTKRDFIAPPISLNPSGDLFDDYEPEVVVEDDPLDNGDAVIELIKELLGPEVWDENDEWSISGTDRYLVVKAPKSIHAKIPRILNLISTMK